MPVPLTIRDLPEATMSELSARAARSGRAVEEYVRAQLIELAARSGATELWDRIEQRVRVTGGNLPADDILRFRDADR
ncbi:FitA-like ribbon-helix-helix domain-containing protein [Trujillonella endophytica]|uniref:Antitoxin FitA-like ribbon-helix-helix domain-containing protein n=1 Tax=Trujillonella endophytica TaxID=673521 RepID=A0A1H8VV18_9ACTN|nr:hypothetical protein [Trujillella endophytica]SEP19205.1 hypothetical protein SAMN05660991_03793 [Trujillella endophytica]